VEVIAILLAPRASSGLGDQAVAYVELGEAAVAEEFQDCGYRSTPDTATAAE